MEGWWGEGRKWGQEINRRLQYQEKGPESKVFFSDGNPATLGTSQ